MRKLLKKVKELMFMFPDPVKKCVLYRNKECSHVDGMLCDFSECRMNKDYKNEK